jgi:hypothetical protein
MNLRPQAPPSITWSIRLPTIHFLTTLNSGAVHLDIVTPILVTPTKIAVPEQLSTETVSSRPERLVME